MWAFVVLRNRITARCDSVCGACCNQSRRRFSEISPLEEFAELRPLDRRIRELRFDRAMGIPDRRITATGAVRKSQAAAATVLLSTRILAVVRHVTLSLLDALGDGKLYLAWHVLP